MKAIYKYRLPFMEVSKRHLPVGAQIIRIDGLDGALWIWAIVDTEAEEEVRTFHLFKTGAKMPDDIVENYNYLGCGAIYVQMELMMYVFERKLAPVVKVVKPDSDGWIEFLPTDESASPVSEYAKVVVKLRDGYIVTTPMQAATYRWDDQDNGSDIVAYKVVE